MTTIRLFRFGSIASLVLALVLSPTSLLAGDRNGLDVTMRMVIDDEDLADGLVQELHLPDPSEGRLSGSEDARGHDKADDMRDEGRALGRQISEEARGRRADGLDLPAESSRDKMGGDRPQHGMDPGGRPDVPDKGGPP
ncbi:hypothetical protein [uncultured Marinobacter sp.]|uniref:hypothetical protein n=1 Tax=uncultured Marinobacter sp. TaxID=187379 RepID=UPI0030D70E2B